MALASVNSSYSGARWQPAPTHLSDSETARMATFFEERLTLPYSLCWHLASIGLTDETIADFLDPKLRTSLPDPYVMKDAEHAINLIVDIIKRKQPIGLFGDYDVDGACSAALFRLVLGAFGVPVWCHIPDRFKEGYGPNLEALKALKSQGQS